ncbi:hypothetical protein AMECASPLE_039847 [Ameca splendens]|uniref:Uncharacterized protein n=1 Tax=Ameca splendens TaxID=208324 RepID=A0ABV0YW60_9TELE
MWVRAISNIMTEHTRQQDLGEALWRTLSEQANQIQFHDSSLTEQQRQTNQQIEQIATLLQQTLGTSSTTPPDGASAFPESFQSPYFRDVTSPIPEKFSEAGNCGGFLLQCSLVFNRYPHSFPFFMIM